MRSPSANIQIISSNLVLGLRVIRGPSWEWGDQDGGEGTVGTVVMGDQNPPRTVSVIWDAGKTSHQYRAGHNGSHDLRVLDNSNLGIKHPYIFCEGTDCQSQDSISISGIRWTCVTCSCNLCTRCYFNEIPHHPDHFKFKRYDNSEIVNPPTVTNCSSEWPQGRIKIHGMGYCFTDCLSVLDIPSTTSNERINISNKFSMYETVQMRNDQETILDMEKELCKPCRLFPKKSLAGEIGRVSGIDPADPGKLFVRFDNKNIYNWLDIDCSLPSKWMEVFKTDTPNVDKELAQLDTTLSSLFFDAVNGGDLRNAKLFHNRGVEITARNSQGETALIIACRLGYSDLVEWLVSQGQNGLEKSDDLGYCAIHRAVLRSSSKILEILIKAGANLNCKTRSGDTAVHIAVVNEYKDCVRILIQHGCDLNAQNSVGNAPLHHCILHKLSDEIIDLLISSGRIQWQLANAENMDIVKLTVSMNASNVIEYFSKYLKHNMSTYDYEYNDQDSFLCLISSEGYSVLHYACLYRNANLVKLLLDQINQLFQPALFREDGPHPLQIFLEAKDRRGRTALLIACNNKDLPVIELITKAGADLNASDVNTNNAILQVILSLDEDHVPSVEDSPSIFNVCQNFFGESTKKLMEEQPILYIIGYLLHQGCSWETGNQAGKKPRDVLLENERISKDAVELLDHLASYWKRRPAGANGCVGKAGECAEQAIYRGSCPHRISLEGCRNCFIPLCQEQPKCPCGKSVLDYIPSPSSSQSMEANSADNRRRTRSATKKGKSVW